MKIKSGFMLREIAEQWIVVPLGERTVEFSAIISLSETGAFIWKLLENGSSKDELIKAVIEEYEVEAVEAETDVMEYLARLEEKGLVK